MAKQSPAQLVSGRLYKITHAEEIETWRKAYYAEHRVHILEHAKAYGAAHAEEKRAKALAYHWAHREERLAYKKAYRAKNRERLLAEGRKRYADNPEKMRAQTKAYKLAHPDKGLSYESMRRAAKQAPGAEKVDVAVLYVRDNKTCTLCHTHVKRSEWSIDHIIPLKHGGQHTYRNTALAHKLCNIRKRDGVVTQQLPMF
jgi:5-methylcytosine-specific restriction endonuclease McrA